MFDIGFLELFFVAVIGLLVLGPERLPVAVRVLGQWIGRARRIFAQFTDEFDRQIQVEDLRAELKEQAENLNINNEIQITQPFTNNFSEKTQSFDI
mgnify:CR=1 FL=1